MTEPQHSDQNRQARPNDTTDDRLQQGAADVGAPLQDLRFIAGLAHTLAEHLRQNWPVQGQGRPAAGPATNITASNLKGHLLHLKTLLFRFHPPTPPSRYPPGSRQEAAC